MGEDSVISGKNTAYADVYRAWLQGSEFDDATKAELRAIAGDAKEIEDRFYKELEFGTAGLRGVLGAGANRMNAYTVGKVTQGLCDALKAGAVGVAGSAADAASSAGAAGASDGVGAAGSVRDVCLRGVAISFDPRRRSREFAYDCASIIAANGLKAYVFEDIRPTPVLSFTVRHLGCAAGIMITASHNPAAYNGYKVYGSDGAQMSVDDSNQVVAYTARLNGYGDIKRLSPEKRDASDLIEVIGSAVDDEYVKKVRALSLRLKDVASDAERLKIVYTPLHGAGDKLVRRVLAENGYKNVFVVPEQEAPDPDFPTVKSPNPESREAFDLAVELAKKVDANVIIGTDPDSDRIGVVFRDHEGEYVALTGNQIGCLLLEYVMRAVTSEQATAGGSATGLTGGDSTAGAARKAAKGIFAVTTIVSTRLAAKIAKRYGADLYEVYTGFKYICGLAEKLEGRGGRFVFGFEESNGYLAGNFVRDKDAVIASMLVAEMAAWLHSQDLTLADALKSLYEEYGYTVDDVVSYTLAGKSGLEAIAGAMEKLRKDRPQIFGGFRVASWKDYGTLEAFDAASGLLTSVDMPERSNVLSYAMEDGSTFLVRPSGTEPKIKIYYSVSAKDKQGASELMRRFSSDVARVVKGYLGIE